MGTYRVSTVPLLLFFVSSNYFYECTGFKLMSIIGMKFQEISSILLPIPLSSGMSFVLSSVLIVLLFSGMQANKQWITASPLQTLFGGFIGSLIFVFSVTAVGNLETLIFGKNFQTKLFPEVAFCYLFTFLSAAMVHRICVTSALILSTIALYYLNHISQKTYTVATPAAPLVPPRKKKH